MEAIHPKYCRGCNCLLYGEQALLSFCSRCVAPCNHNSVTSLEQLRRGEMVRCKECRNDVISLQCPYKQCIFCVPNSYRQGMVVFCTKCNGPFRQVICSCGQAISCQAGTENDVILAEGDTKIRCDKCKNQFHFSTCNHCHKINHSRELVRNGETVGCSHCRRDYIVLWCAKCFRPVKTDNFRPGATYTCTYPDCGQRFDYTWCMFCMNCTGTLNSDEKYYNKKCNKEGCGRSYFHMVCTNCHESLYMDELLLSREHKDRCAKCRKQFKVLYCSVCKNMHVNDEKCEMQERQRQLHSFLGVDRPEPPRPKAPVGTGMSLFTAEPQPLFGRLPLLFGLPPSPPPQSEPASSNLLFTFGSLSLDSATEEKKESKEENSKPKPVSETSDKVDPTCKVCLTNTFCMLNKSCNHLAICETCYDQIKAKERTSKVSCVVCRAKGDYIKIFTS